MIRTDFSSRGIPWAELVLARESDAGALNLGLRHRLSALASVSLLVSLGLRRYRVAAASAAAFTVLNRDFYVLVRAAARSRTRSRRRCSCTSRTH